MCSMQTCRLELERERENPLNSVQKTPLIPCRQVRSEACRLFGQTICSYLPWPHRKGEGKEEKQGKPKRKTERTAREYENSLQPPHLHQPHGELPKFNVNMLTGLSRD